MIREARRGSLLASVAEARLRRLIGLGREQYRAGDFEQAERHLSEVVKENCGFADVFNMLGVIHHGREQFGEAEYCFERALKINPQYTEAALNLAVTYNDRGKYAEARHVYEAARAKTDHDPNQVDRFVRGKIANMHADLGAVYADTGMYEEAVREFEKALELCPGFIDIRTRLALVYRDSGRPQAAVAEFQQVLRERADYSPARVALGVTLYSLGERAEAIEQWRLALRLNPEDRHAGLYLRMAEAKHPPRPGSAAGAGASNPPSRRSDEDVP
jgi:tetratricopeptide (TPR) repeat protein